MATVAGCICPRWLASEAIWAPNSCPVTGTPVTRRNWSAIMTIATPAR